VAQTEFINIDELRLLSCVSVSAYSLINCLSHVNTRSNAVLGVTG
jgi:hypothetical protein